MMNRNDAAVANLGVCLLLVGPKQLRENINL
jgi:hypothetical protein